MQSGAAVPSKLNGRLIMNVIRRLRGSTTVEIKKYLKTEKGLEYDTASIKLYLKNAVERGKLTLIDGKYRIKEIAKRKPENSGSRRRQTRKGASKRKRPSGQMKMGKERSGSWRRKRSKKAAAKAVEGANAAPTDHSVQEEARGTVDQEVVDEAKKLLLK